MVRKVNKQTPKACKVFLLCCLIASAVTLICSSGLFAHVEYRYVDGMMVRENYLWAMITGSGYWGLTGWWAVFLFAVYSMVATTSKSLRDNGDLHLGIARSVFIFFTVTSVILGLAESGAMADDPLVRCKLLSVVCTQTVQGFAAGSGLLLLAVSIFMLRCRTEQKIDLFFVTSLLFPLFISILLLTYYPMIVLFYICSKG